MTLKSKMKDSGVEWIKDIPENWDVQKVKYLVKDRLAYGANETGDDETLNGIRYIRITDIDQSGNLQNNGGVYLERNKALNYLLEDGDILLARSGATVGKSFLYNQKYGEACFAGYLIRARPESSKLLSRFFYYYTKSKPYFDFIALETIQATIQNVNGNKYNNLFVILPSTNEQEIIVEYLDNQCSLIDNQIILRNKLSRLLKEKRQALINQTVTRGLDVKISLKPSEIEWIGDIPEHWKVNKIKFTSSVKGRIGWQGLRSDEFIEDGPYLITGTEFKSGTVLWKNCHHVEKWRYEQDPYIQIRKEDVLITKDGTIGKVAYIKDIPGPTTLNAGVMVIRSTRNTYLPRFMFWVLQSDQFLQYVEYTKAGSTIKHLYQETFENFAYAYPESHDEQKQIFEYLDTKIESIDNAILQLQKVTKLLRERKSTIISDGVTGKIQLRSN